MHPVHVFADLDPAEAVHLPKSERFPEADHLWRTEELDALTLALASHRPLLVRGEAGSGKSQIARAAAKVLNGCEPIVEVIHSRFEALELLYRVDSILRLSDASAVGQLDPTNERYVIHGALWRALAACSLDRPRPVLLVDEIDKAEADVPNALLDVLANRSFEVPMLGNRTIGANDGPDPLIILATNEERELPAAFVRRCIVLNLKPPADETAFKVWMVERGKVHRRLDVDADIRLLTADQVWVDRCKSIDEGYPPVGLAEYLDLLQALHELSDRAGNSADARRAVQRDWLTRLSRYALVKHAAQDQSRLPVAAPQRGGAGS